LLHCPFGAALPTVWEAVGRRWWSAVGGGGVVGVLESGREGELAGEGRSRHAGYLDRIRHYGYAEPAGLAAVAVAVAKNCLICRAADGQACPLQRCMRVCCLSSMVAWDTGARERVIDYVARAGAPGGK
jgi:hypothetical protein